MAATMLHAPQRHSLPPGKPNKNAYIDRFNGKFRAECMNEHWFIGLAHARRIIVPNRFSGRDCERPAARTYSFPAATCHAHPTAMTLNDKTKASVERVPNGIVEPGPIPEAPATSSRLDPSRATADMCEGRRAPR